VLGLAKSEIGKTRFRDLDTPRRPRLKASMLVTVLLAVVLIVAARPTSSKGAVTGPFELLGGQVTGELSAVLSPDNEAEFKFVRADPQREGRAQLHISSFQSSDKRTALVGFPDPSGRGPIQPQRDEVLAAQQRLLAVRLSAPSLMEGVDYQGTLSLIVEGTAPQSWKVTLHKRKAEVRLALDAQDVQIVDTLPVFPTERTVNARLRLTVREKEGRQAIDGFFARREGTATSPRGTLDLGRHVRFFLDGGSSPTDLTRWPLRSGEPPRVIARGGGQVPVDVEIFGLGAGEHKFALQFDAPAAVPGPEQKLAVTMKLKHHVLWAVAVLVIAAIVSYIFTKGLVNSRAKTQIEGKIDALQRDRLPNLRPFGPVIWLRAVLRQSADLMARMPFLLPAPQNISERLERATRLQGVLDEYWRLGAQVTRAGLSRMREYRTRRLLDQIVRDIDPEKLDDDAVRAARTALDKIRETLGKPSDDYRATVTARARQLLRTIPPPGRWSDAVTTPATLKEALDGSALTKLNALYKTLDGPEGKKLADAPDGKSLTDDEIEQLDRSVVVLEILWERRERAENLKALLQHLPEGGGPSEQDMLILFTLADRQDWTMVKQALDGGKATIVPSDTEAPLQPIEAYQPTTFSIKFDDARLDTMFVVTSLIQCDWLFRLPPRGAAGEESAAESGDAKRRGPRWKESSVGRSIVQFPPHQGSLEISVDVRYDGGEARVPHGANARETLTIDPAKEFSRFASYTRTEFAGVAIAMVIAMASGLSLYYVSNDTFGTLKEYVALFLWGVGVDQGKNLIQALPKPS
jgi:hypothetical protein